MCAGKIINLYKKRIVYPGPRGFLAFGGTEGTNEQ